MGQLSAKTLKRQRIPNWLAEKLRRHELLTIAVIRDLEDLMTLPVYITSATTQDNCLSVAEQLNITLLKATPKGRTKNPNSYFVRHPLTEWASKWDGERFLRVGRCCRAIALAPPLNISRTAGLTTKDATCLGRIHSTTPDH